MPITGLNVRMMRSDPTQALNSSNTTLSWSTDPPANQSARNITTRERLGMIRICPDPSEQTQLIPPPHKHSPPIARDQSS